MSFVQANGLTFHVQELGQGSPVVLLHGMLLSNLTTWYFGVAPVLAERHRVFMYDLRGHGKSQRAPRGYDLGTLASDLKELVARYDGVPISVGGFSYGALVALRFAIDQPSLVRRLILVETPLPPHKLEETRSLIEANTDDLLATLHPDRLRRALGHFGVSRERILRDLPPGFENVLFKGNRRLRKLLDATRYLINESTILDDVRAEPDFGDEDLANVVCPVLCVYGKRSGCRHVAERLLDTMRDARLQEIDCGHYVPSERPRELARLIKEFLDG